MVRLVDIKHFPDVAITAQGLGILSNVRSANDARNDVVELQIGTGGTPVAELVLPCTFLPWRKVVAFTRLFRPNNAPAIMLFAVMTFTCWLPTSLHAAAQYHTGGPIELRATYITLEEFTNSHVASIESSREFGETLNRVTNYPMSHLFSQYRAEPLLKSTEGVTTRAWSLIRASGMAVKPHERGSQAFLGKVRDSLDYRVTDRSADKEPHDNTTDSDWDTLNISASDVISAAQYQWRQIAINIVASGRELRINSGEAQIIKLAAARLKNAIRTFGNNFCSDLYSAGSLSNQINGLQAIVADTNTNTVGGIDGNVWGFWKNTVFDLSDNSVTISATTIETGAMLPLWLSLDRGPDDQPDLIVADTTYYTYFEGSQTSLKRYASTDKAQGGFVSLKYKNADVIYDGNSGIPSAHMYFINTNYMKLVAHKDANMTEMDSLHPVNQDGSVIPILWMGNVICSNRAQQGVIKA